MSGCPLKTHIGKFRAEIWNFFVEFVTFLDFSSDCDSHNTTWREKKSVCTENGDDID